MNLPLSRRNFIKIFAAAFAYLGISKKISFAQPPITAAQRLLDSPVVISTWKHGLAANEEAWRIIKSGGDALDAVEKGVNVSEDDPEVMSVGYGGLPDREGFVTLDSCIMDKNGNAGAVAFIQNYRNPISVARKVMENTKHIMLVGKGAKDFAQKMGFKPQNLLTEKAKNRWIEWKASQNDNHGHNSHDTIGMLALDAKGNMAGACTTSGLAWKMHGRVGDSPIIGAGLYVDNNVGGAACTGIGEECIKVCGSFLVVEYMRKGATPTEACFEAVKRIAARHKEKIDFQVAFIALNIQGETGAASLSKGFEYALMETDNNQLLKSKYLL